MSILVTGAAGFIGAYVCRALVARGETVHGLDDFNAYYPSSLKRDRLKALCPEVPVAEVDIADADAFAAAVDAATPTRIVHLAAQAGVRYGLDHPHHYGRSNLVGMLNVLEAARRHRVAHLVYASSSSVYGASAVVPFDEAQRVDAPLSLYAATKAANELMAHSYAHLFGIPSTGLRFFTVYGPWGRPDMAPVLFARAILGGRPIEVFNRGRMRRDFTHVDDIVAGVLAALGRPPGEAGAVPHRIFNLGSSAPIELERFIAIIEQAAGRPALRNERPMQAGDMRETCADTTRAERMLGYRQSREVETALPEVVAWVRDYYGEHA